MIDKLQKLLNANPEIVKILEKIKAHKGDFNDSFNYATKCAEEISKYLGEEITSPEIEQLCVEALKQQYENVNDVLQTVQRDMDLKRGINIKPQRAEFPIERVEKIAHSLADKTVPVETLKRRAESVENVAISFHDDYVVANSEFRSDAGLDCYIIRISTGKCCKWCNSLAGRYHYGTEPKDVYRRHDNCRCETYFDNYKNSTRQDVWSKKTTKFKDQNTTYEPKVLDKDTSRQIESENLRFKGLTDNSQGGIIKIDMQFFAKSSKDFETVILPKDEYAHVMSEIATNISKEQEKKRVFTTAIGNFNYTVENNGFGNYRIVGKEKLI